MNTTINHETKTISVVFSKKSEMPVGRAQLVEKKRILAANGLTLGSGYAIYFDYKKTEAQLTAIARKFDDMVKPESDEPAMDIYELNRISRLRQAGSSLRR